MSQGHKTYEEDKIVLKTYYFLVELKGFDEFKDFGNGHLPN